MTQHRAGRLKQINKKHKTPGGTRPSNEGAVSGRTQRKFSKNTNAAQVGKQDRLNRHKQLMQEKRLQSIRMKRQATSSKTTYIAVLPLSNDIRVSSVFNFILNNNQDFTFKASDDHHHGSNRFTLQSKSQKSNYTFFTPGLSEFAFDPLAVATVVSTCHSVMLLIDLSEEMAHPLIDDLGEKTIQLLMAFGFPGISVGFLSSTSQKFNMKNPPKPWRSELEKTTSQLSVFADLKYYDLKDGNLPRYLFDQSKVVKWRQQRSYLISQQLQIVDEDAEGEGEGEDESNSGYCKIVLQGVLQGAPMSVNSLVHIAGVGTARISKVTKVNTHHHHKSQQMIMEEGDGMDDDLNEDSIEADPEKQDDLQLEAEADILQGEQTWPEESEMIQNDNNNINQYHDEEGDDDLNVDEEDEVMGFFNREQLAGSSKPKTSEVMEEEDGEGGAGEAEEDEEERGDFVDSPFDMSARSRFARYRALQSFRSSVWHPKENLPEQYSKIFQFEDIKGMQKRLSNYVDATLKKQFEPFLQIYQSSTRSRSTSQNTSDEMMMEMETGSVQSSTSHSVSKSKSTKQLQEDLPLLLDGTEDMIRSDQIVTIELDQVPKEAIQQQYEKDGYIVFHSLHRHEYKLSIMHFTIKRVPGNTDVIRSKDELLFYHGFRSYWTKPIFSESNLNCDKHKFQRFLPMDGFSVASCIGPVLMTPSTPLLIYKRSLVDGSLQLVATGNLLSIDPDRIMLKKIILTGNPIRVKKRSGVIKHMFYDPLDVRYFKPAELVTKHGLRGYIKESVGTHGLFKAHFSSVITQNDKVWLILYKRVFPKIPEEGVIVK